MRHRSLLVRKEADISAQLSSWPTQQLRMELTQEPLRVLVQHMRPKVKPVRSIEKFCGILMTLLDRSGRKSPRLAATQILNRSRNNSQCQALLWPNVSIVLSAWCRQVHIRLSPRSVLSCCALHHVASRRRRQRAMRPPWGWVGIRPDHTADPGWFRQIPTARGVQRDATSGQVAKDRPTSPPNCL